MNCTAPAADVYQTADFAFSMFYNLYHDVGAACDFSGVAEELPSDQWGDHCVSPAPMPETACVAKRDASTADMQAQLDWACNFLADNDDFVCERDIPANCKSPAADVYQTADFAFSTYYKLHQDDGATCYFSGFAEELPRDQWSDSHCVSPTPAPPTPAPTPVPSSGACVAKRNAATADVQANVDWACQHMYDLGDFVCETDVPVNCQYPAADLYHTADFVFGTFFKIYQDQVGTTCDFAGTAEYLPSNLWADDRCVSHREFNLV